MVEPSVEEDFDEDELEKSFGEGFQDQILALKKACLAVDSANEDFDIQIGDGKAGNGTEKSVHGNYDNDDFEDDDSLLLSVQQKWGASVKGKPADFKTSQKYDNNQEIEYEDNWDDDDDDDDDDDEQLLQRVKSHYGLHFASNETNSKNSDPANGLIDPAFPDTFKRLQVGPACELREFSKDTHEPLFNELLHDEPLHNESGTPAFLESSQNGADNEVDSPKFPCHHFDSLDDLQLDQTFLPDGICGSTGSMEVLENVLKKNRKCQVALRGLLSKLEVKQKENKELQRRMKTILGFEKYCKRDMGILSDRLSPSIKLILPLKTKPKRWKFTQSKYWGPPENKDIEVHKRLQTLHPAVFSVRNWSMEERRELSNGVKQQIQHHLLREAMKSAMEGIDQNLSLEDEMQEIKERVLTPEDIKNFLNVVDWEDVARIYVLGRSASDCQSRWLHHEDPLINHGPWSKSEDINLLQIAKRHNFCDWEAIANQLHTNRTASQCLIRYQRSLNASVMHREWSHEEDEQLCLAVKSCGLKDWQAIAACLEGRTGSQCADRWNRKHLGRQRRGRWSVEEDKRLTLAVSVYGAMRWKRIAEHVQGRTEMQCRERWRNVLDPKIKHEAWTEEEDRHLEEAVKKHGPHRWAAVAADLAPRTDNQCWRRWKQLYPERRADFHKDVQIKRHLLPNFTKRSKERPCLDLTDFSEHFKVPQDSRQETKGRRKKAGLEKAHAKIQKQRMGKTGDINRKQQKNKQQKDDILEGDKSSERQLSEDVLDVPPLRARIKESREKAVPCRDFQNYSVGEILPSGPMPSPGFMDPKIITDVPESDVLEVLHMSGLENAEQQTLTFVSLLRAITSYCSLLRADEASSEIEMPLESQGKVPKHGLQKLSAEEKKRFSDHEIAALMRALLSFPFLLGMRSMWTFTSGHSANSILSQVKSSTGKSGKIGSKPKALDRIELSHRIVTGKKKLSKTKRGLCNNITMGNPFIGEGRAKVPTRKSDRIRKSSNGCIWKQEIRRFFYSDVQTHIMRENIDGVIEAKGAGRLGEMQMMGSLTVQTEASLDKEGRKTSSTGEGNGSDVNMVSSVNSTRKRKERSSSTSNATETTKRTESVTQGRKRVTLTKDRKLASNDHESFGIGSDNEPAVIPKRRRSGRQTQGIMKLLEDPVRQSQNTMKLLKVPDAAKPSPAQAEPDSMHRSTSNLLTGQDDMHKNSDNILPAQTETASLILSGKADNPDNVDRQSTNPFYPAAEMLEDDSINPQGRIVSSLGTNPQDGDVSSVAAEVCSHVSSSVSEVCKNDIPQERDPASIAVEACKSDFINRQDRDPPSSVAAEVLESNLIDQDDMVVKQKEEKTLQTYKRRNTSIEKPLQTYKRRKKQPNNEAEFGLEEIMPSVLMALKQDGSCPGHAEDNFDGLEKLIAAAAHDMCFS